MFKICFLLEDIETLISGNAHSFVPTSVNDSWWKRFTDFMMQKSRPMGPASGPMLGQPLESKPLNFGPSEVKAAPISTSVPIKNDINPERNIAFEAYKRRMAMNNALQENPPIQEKPLINKDVETSQQVVVTPKRPISNNSPKENVWNRIDKVSNNLENRGVGLENARSIAINRGINGQDLLDSNGRTATPHARIPAGFKSTYNNINTVQVPSQKIPGAIDIYNKVGYHSPGVPYNPNDNRYYYDLNKKMMMPKVGIPPVSGDNKYYYDPIKKMMMPR